MAKKKNRTYEFKALTGRKYLAFFKPYAVLCQFTKEPGSEKQTLVDFGFPKNVYPIGRLDFDSEGLLLLSDDGRLNQLLLDPENSHWRTYLVQLEHLPGPDALEKLRKGVLIDGRLTLPARVRLLECEPELPERPVPIRYRKSIPTAWIELSLKEGKNRQVRRMTAAVGHPTLRLVRAAIGSLQIAELGLAPGAWIELNSGELSKCFDSNASTEQKFD